MMTTAISTICGTYVGFCGKRKVRLQIRHSEAEQQDSVYHFRFVELESENAYVTTSPFDDQLLRTFSDLVLSREDDGVEQVTLTTLHRHPWDVNYLSGEEITSGARNGVFLRRVPD